MTRDNELEIDRESETRTRAKRSRNWELIGDLMGALGTKEGVLRERVGFLGFKTISKVNPHVMQVMRTHKLHNPHLKRLITLSTWI